MDYLPDQETLSLWLTQYGSFVLLILLALGIIALPVPEETLMTLAGVLMSQGKLHILPTIIAAYLGSVIGISMSYLLGRTLGHFFIIKYGSWVGITEERFKQAHNWFERFGTWALFIGYFIPGVRHFTGFTAGSASLEYKYFAIFAYSGALLWVSTFLSIGYFLGDYWTTFLEHLDIDMNIIIIVGIILFIILSFIYALKKKRANDLNP